jgi:hypothetical protein
MNKGLEARPLRLQAARTDNSGLMMNSKTTNVDFEVDNDGTGLTNDIALITQSASRCRERKATCC